jgi:hypothetical protein
MQETCDKEGNCTVPKTPAIGDAANGICERDDDPCGTWFVVESGRVSERIVID